MIMAGALTTIIFAFTHEIFANAAEVIGFYVGTQTVLTYAVWTMIDLWKRKRV